MMIFFAAKNLLTILVYAYRQDFSKFQLCQLRFSQFENLARLEISKVWIKTSLLVDKM